MYKRKRQNLTQIVIFGKMCIRAGRVRAGEVADVGRQTATDGKNTTKNWNKLAVLT